MAAGCYCASGEGRKVRRCRDGLGVVVGSDKKSGNSRSCCANRFFPALMGGISKLLQEIFEVFECSKEKLVHAEGTVMDHNFQVTLVEIANRRPRSGHFHLPAAPAADLLLFDPGFSRIRTRGLAANHYPAGRMEPQFQKLDSGKVIIRQFADDGSIAQEIHSYGALDIAIQLHFKEGKRVEELYFAKRRMVSRRSYEKARLFYPDMPSADLQLEDVSGGLLTDVRREQRRRKAAAERRLKASAESRFPRPTATNWLRIISAEQAHLVEFASRDWKALTREKTLPTGPKWLSLFGFDGPLGGSSVSEGLIIGYEAVGRREEMLHASRMLLDELDNSAPVVGDTTSFSKKTKRRKATPIAWTHLLPRIIQFLESLNAPTVTIFNHHR